MVKGRFAPSPTGRMHLGNIYCALVSWLSARSQGGSWLLRIEDLDASRSRLAFAEQIERDLSALGLDWDEGGLEGRGGAGPYRQSLRGAVYEQYFERVSHLAYPCTCKRADLLAADAPHMSDGRVVYSGRCRPEHLRGALSQAELLQRAMEHAAPVCSGAAARLAVPYRVVSLVDRNYGRVSVNLAAEVGDFVVRRADGGWAYQFAVVVDDALMGVTEVVRGSDLLLSAPQQIYLHELLGFTPPSFAHIPLVCNENGQRLCKRDLAMDMGALLDRFRPEEIVGLAAWVGGLTADYEPIMPCDLISGFNWDKVPCDPVIASLPAML